MKKRVGDRLTAKNFSILDTLLLSIFLPFTIFFFGASFTYFLNIYEFTVSYKEILPFLLLFSIIFSLIFFAIITFLNFKRCQLIISFLLAISFLFWIQGTLLVWDYGVLDGRTINWVSQENLTRGGIEFIVWITFVFLTLKIKNIFRHRAAIIIILLIVQLLSLIYLIPKALVFNPWWNEYIFTSDNKYTFSSNENVILIILDSFQASIFQEILDENKEYAQYFNGFTFYRNSAGAFPYTQPSIPLILTGKAYDNSLPFLTFTKKQFSENSIPKILKKNDYLSEIYPLVPNSVYLDNEIATNVKQKVKQPPTNRQILQALAGVLDITLFRYSPVPAKTLIYRNQQWLFRSIASKYTTSLSVAVATPINRDVTSIENMLKEAKVDYEKNVFKFYHFDGVHSPLNLNENLDVVRLSESRLNHKKQSIAMIKLMKMFLDKLKSIQAFDNSLIIITGDHGYGPIGIHDSQNNKIIDDPNYLREELFQGAALPLMLIKPFQSKGPLKISNAPVALSDIPKTIFSILGIENNSPGESIISIDESAKRTRNFYLYSWKWLQKNEFLPPLKEYTINGNSWNEDSWALSYKTLEPERILFSTPPAYSFGNDIKFGKGKEGTFYEVLGWDSKTYRDFSWSIQKYASMHIPLKSTDRNLKIEFILKPLIHPGKIDKQKVDIYLNDSLQEELTLTNQNFETFIFTLPNNQFQDSNLLKIAFRFPDAARPIDFGIGPEKQERAVQLKKIVINEY